MVVFNDCVMPESVDYTEWAFAIIIVPPQGQVLFHSMVIPLYHHSSHIPHHIVPLVTMISQFLTSAIESDCSLGRVMHPVVIDFHSILRLCLHLNASPIILNFAMALTFHIIHLYGCSISQPDSC